ncbi:amidohydrolase family protein [Parvularcula oceani]|uniref:amidohydrolase family protein n=1 Tax=Parvularcula oceani TaxID=1247963 RepID=UPI0004E10A18|nr:amidohydrolase family protein [Parvularcula oceani]
MRDIPFVDAHVHFWELGRLDYDWLTPPFSDEGVNGDVSAIAHDYGPADYMRDAEGWRITGAVHVDAGAATEQALAETAWLEALAAETGLPSAIVAHVPLHRADADDLLAQQADHPSVRGIRQIVNHHPDPQRTYLGVDMTGNADWQAGFRALGRHGLSFDLQAYPHQFPVLADLFAQAPDTPVIVNHLGMAFPDETEAWRQGMARLAELPQVSVKISGFGITHRGWTEDSIRPLILEALDLFGPSRLMAASDFPTDKLHARFEDCLCAYAAILSDLSEDEKRDIWGRNAARTYRIEGLS